MHVCCSWMPLLPILPSSRIVPPRLTSQVHYAECGTPCYGPASHAAARSLLFPISAFELWILFFIGSRLNHCGCPKLGFLLYIVGPHTWKETIMFVDLLLTCASCIPQEDSHERSTPRGTVMLCILTFEPRA
jgi:hypothetical protein